jgi:hypothetical protein
MQDSMQEGSQVISPMIANRLKQYRQKDQGLEDLLREILLNILRFIDNVDYS